jgi:putative membrane protein
MKYLILVLKGVAYGITNLVPAIGGGTILILLHIYEQFVDAWGNLLNYRRWKEIIPFLFFLGLGAAVGMVALSRLINVLLEQYEAPTMLFFIGLLVGTIPSVFRMHRDMRFTVGRGIALLVGIAFVVAMRIVRERSISGADREINSISSFIYNVVVCFLAGGASVTPGLDGSSIFMLGGTYKAITGALSALAHLEIRWATIISTALGAAPGIIIFSRLISAAIKRAPSVTYYCVLGIIAGSVYGLWPKIGSSNILILILTFVVGLALALYFNRPTAPAEGAGKEADMAEAKVE